MPGRYTARYKYKNMPVIQKYVFEFSNDLAIILLFHFTRVCSNNSYKHIRQMKYSLNGTHY